MLGGPGTVGGGGRWKGVALCKQTWPGSQFYPGPALADIEGNVMSSGSSSANKSDI